MNIFLLVMSLLSTSLMVLCNDQALQAVLASIISLACIVILHHARPFRVRTDNAVSLGGQILIFMWTYCLLVRVIRVLDEFHTVAVLVSVSLVIATTALCAFAFHAIREDLPPPDSVAGASSDTLSSMADDGPASHTAEEMNDAAMSAEDDRSEGAFPAVVNPPAAPLTPQVEDDQVSCMEVLVLCSDRRAPHFEMKGQRI